MAVNWNLGEQFLGGASLAARIAGQVKQQDFQRQELEDQESTSSAESVARTGFTPEELNDPSSGAAGTVSARMKAAADSQQKLQGAQADYFSGRNAAYSAAAGARAAAAAGKLGRDDLQKQIKDFDQMSMIDPDGSKGIYTPDRALQHAALMNRFNLLNGVATPPASGAPAAKPGMATPSIGNMTSPISDLSGSLATRAAGGIMGWFGGGGAPAPAAATPAPAASAAGMVRVRNKQTGATGSMRADDPNLGNYEQIGQ